MVETQANQLRVLIDIDITIYEKGEKNERREAQRRNE